MPIPRCAAALLSLALVACAHAQAGRPAGPLRVVATTTTLASIVSGTLGNRSVTSLVPVGASPEDFQPSPDAIGALRDADILVENGAGLEGWLDATVRNAGNPNLRIVVCTDGLPVRDGNPHLWMDPEYARGYARRIRDALIAADAAHAAAYRTSAARYDRDLGALTARTRSKLAAIPPERRTMIVFHNAYDYYARRFGMRIVGAIEPNPGSEPNPAHIADLVRLARAEHVPAVFAEREYSDRLARALARSAGGLKVAFLYDDSLPPGASANYISMIDEDTDTIVNALR